MKTDEVGGRFIRATQGHSIIGLDEEKIFKKVEDPAELPVCVHGTYAKFWNSIKVWRMCLWIPRPNFVTVFCTLRAVARFKHSEAYSYSFCNG